MGELYRPGVLRWGSCTALVCCDGHQQVAGASEILSHSLPLTKGNTTSCYKAATNVTERSTSCDMCHKAALTGASLFNNDDISVANFAASTQQSQPTSATWTSTLCCRRSMAAAAAASRCCAQQPRLAQADLLLPCCCQPLHLSWCKVGKSMQHAVGGDKSLTRCMACRHQQQHGCVWKSVLVVGVTPHSSTAMPAKRT